MEIDGNFKGLWRLRKGQGNSQGSAQVNIRRAQSNSARRGDPYRYFWTVQAHQRQEPVLGWNEVRLHVESLEHFWRREEWIDWWHRHGANKLKGPWIPCQVPTIGQCRWMGLARAGVRKAWHPNAIHSAEYAAAEWYHRTWVSNHQEHGLC